MDCYFYHEPTEAIRANIYGGAESNAKIPRSATRSTMSRPWSLNLVMMVGRVLLGAGMSLLEPCTLAPRESLRPNGTIQPGPPVCNNSTKHLLI